jgi:phytoene dehydrogenase-like protein
VARIIVIGAGVAGLAAAARMASGVNEVTLVERNPSPGGSVTWAGPHTLTLPATLRDLFVKTGGRKAGAAGALEDVVDLRPVDPVRRYVFPDGTRLDLPNSSRGATKDAFDAAFGAGAGAAWLGVLDHGGRAWSAIRPTLVEVPDAGRGDLWRLLRDSAARRALGPRRTLRQVGAEAGLRDPRMLRILDEYALGAGAEPERAPAVLSIRPYIEHVFGAWRVVGGPTVLIDALYERCVKRGVTFRFGTEVRSVATGAVTLADGERLGADTIVAALDARVLAGLTGAKPSRETYSPSAFSVRLDGPSGVELPHESVFFGDSGPQPTIRVHVAPERPTQWIASIDATVETNVDARRLADELTKRLGIAADAVTVRDVLTPADRERLTDTPGGSLHGPTADSLSSAVLRSPTVQPIKGLLHIGASARPGPGVAFAALGAWNAAEVLRPTRV